MRGGDAYFLEARKLVSPRKLSRLSDAHGYAPDVSEPQTVPRRRKILVELHGV